jgi:hypothetical protein
MPMPKRHKIQQGESAVRLSDTYGFFAETIWNHAENAALRERREDMNILLPGDILFIPDKTLKEVRKPSGQKHVFRRKGIPAMLRLQLFVGEEPRARQSYRLIVDGKVSYGTTSAEGVLKKFISPQAQDGELVIGPDEFRVQLVFGHLDPVMELIGVQKRLNNLGYDCGVPDGTLNEQTRDALLRFQHHFGLPVTGTLTDTMDDPTRQKLRELHDKDAMFPDPPPAPARS